MLNSLTEKATFNLLNVIYDALNKIIIVGGIFCNQEKKKAFDCVDHGISLSKLKFCSIRGKVFRLIQNILGGRISESTNKCKKLTQHNIYRVEKSFFRVPQGSFLGLLLFVIYINDLPLIIDSCSFPILIADYIRVVITDTNSTNFLSNSKERFSQLNKRLSANLLLLN